MKTTFLLAAAAATLATIGTVSAEPGEYICETSDASPYLHNVNELVDNLNNEKVGVNLCNPGPVNGCGKTNTGYSGSGGAAFMICGPDMRCSGDPGGVPCAGSACGGISARELGGYFGTLRDKCQSPDSKGDIRIGGRIHWDGEGGVDDTDYKLFSKPG